MPEKIRIAGVNEGLCGRERGILTIQYDPAFAVDNECHLSTQTAYRLSKNNIYLRDETLACGSVLSIIFPPACRDHGRSEEHVVPGSRGHRQHGRGRGALVDEICR